MVLTCGAQTFGSKKQCKLTDYFRSCLHAGQLSVLRWFEMNHEGHILSSTVNNEPGPPKAKGQCEERGFQFSRVLKASNMRLKLALLFYKQKRPPKANSVEGGTALFSRLPASWGCWRKAMSFIGPSSLLLQKGQETWIRFVLRYRQKPNQPSINSLLIHYWTLCRGQSKTDCCPLYCHELIWENHAVLFFLA